MSLGKRLGAVAALAALLAIAGPAGIVRAEVIVLESEVSGLAPGAVLADNTRLEVPDGKTVRVILPSGRTQTIEGPYSGPAGDFAKGESKKTSLWSTLIDFLTSGGRSESAFGGVRSVVPGEAPPAPMPFSWHVVPVDAEGPICLEQGSNLYLGRPDATHAEKAVMIDKASGAKADLHWSAGVATLHWPASLPVRQGAAFTIEAMDRPSRELILQLVAPPLPDETHLLPVLAERGCKRQIEAWLRDKLGPGWKPGRK